MSRSNQMPVSIPRVEKRGAGRTNVSETPLHIRVRGLDPSSALADRARRRVSKKLGRFAFHITRISIRFSDENGPKGGVDIVCRFKVVVPAAPDVVAEGRAADAYSAFDRALKAVSSALSRSLERRRRGVPKPKRSAGAKPVRAKRTRAPNVERVRRPSRKSTRGKHDDELRLRATIDTRSPAAKALRAHTKHRMPAAWSRVEQNP